MIANVIMHISSYGTDIFRKKVDIKALCINAHIFIETDLIYDCEIATISQHDDDVVVFFKTKQMSHDMAVEYGIRLKANGWKKISGKK